MSKAIQFKLMETVDTPTPAQGQASGTMDTQTLGGFVEAVLQVIGN